MHLSSAPSKHPVITLQVLVVAFKNAFELHFEHSAVFSALHSEQSDPQALHFPSDPFAYPDLQVVQVVPSVQIEHPSMQDLHVLAVAS